MSLTTLQITFIIGHVGHGDTRGVGHGDISAEHLVFSRLVRQIKSPNFRTLVLSLLLYLGLSD